MSEAFGRPGIEPRWTHGDKEGVGTSYNTASRIWFTLWKGIVTEVYSPHVDTPQIRDFQILVSDGKSKFYEEKKLNNVTTRLDRSGGGYHVSSHPADDFFSVEKDVITDPHASALLVHYSISSKSMKRLRIFLLCAPHLGGEGRHNNGEVIDVSGYRILHAFRDNMHMAITSTAKMTKASVGFVGFSDGWTDISEHFVMQNTFETATDGNIALTAELDPSSSADFTVCLSFGDSRNNAVTKGIQAILVPFAVHRERFLEQWVRAEKHLLPLEGHTFDNGNLYHSSYHVILSHEDKTYEGAIIASLSIPWGETVGDENRGGYHLVWARDMYHSATAALAAGNTQIAVKALVFLSASQQDNGGFPQNFWLTGEAYWKGVQLDETAFSIILAWRCLQLYADREDMLPFDSSEMVFRAASYLIKHGPVTQQERWEENSGYSPSTMASNITAMICASEFASQRGDEGAASLFRMYADFLWSHIEEWTVTDNSRLVPGIRRHFVRILPASPFDPDSFPQMENAFIRISNHADCENNTFLAKEIIDGGFLELVRYGIMRADDPLIVDSVAVLDAKLKVETPYGPVWHRYNNDGYGETADGEPYIGFGVGRAWPLLTGERGHYELALGHNADTYVQAMEKFASRSAMLPEQVWDLPDIPEKHLFLGKHTGSARPLAWAHAEYIKLVRSISDGRVFDRIQPVFERYCSGHGNPELIELWKPNRKIRRCSRKFALKILGRPEFVLHIGVDGWKNVVDLKPDSPVADFHVVSVPEEMMKAGSIDFTFYYPGEKKWEGMDYRIDLLP